MTDPLREAIAELVIENLRLRRELELYRSIEAVRAERTYDSLMAAVGLRPADRRSPGVERVLEGLRS